MKIAKLLVTAVISAGLAFGVAAQAKEQKGEMVDMKSLPTSVKKTIKEKAAGGDVTHVMREDDPNGRWNYEVTVKSNGKEWRFEVDPSGNFVKKHGG